MGLFITFEGGEGTGKTSQARQLWDRLRVEGYVCSLVREPGGTALGEKLRPLLKGQTPPTPIAELLLFSAARAELVTRHIGPELERGSIVIADRYVHSTIAYQGYGYEGRKRWADPKADPGRQPDRYQGRHARPYDTAGHGA